MASVYNFNAGPAVLPRPVLEQAQAELLDYAGTGMSVMEMSHRSKVFEALNADTETRVKRLLGLDDRYRALFVQGGASTQFAMVPLNLAPPDSVVDFVLTGVWSDKAIEEARALGRTTHVAASTKAEQYRRIPEQHELQFSADPAYVHVTTNNTIYGTQWQALPDVGDRALVADMSSDILSAPIDASRFALIYAGAQKNLGPSGVTLVVIRNDLLERPNNGVPTMLRYSTHARNNSLYNTPPTFGVYLMNLVLQWIEEIGGLDAVANRNAAKAALVYDTIDASGGFYRGHADPASRSRMNATFRLPEEALEKQFVSESAAAGFVGLAGHRSVGGIRASMYNALEPTACAALADFMREFQRTHG